MQTPHIISCIQNQAYRRQNKRIDTVNVKLNEKRIYLVWLHFYIGIGYYWYISISQAQYILDIPWNNWNSR